MALSEGLSRGAQYAVLPSLFAFFGFACFQCRAVMSRLSLVDGVMTEDGDAAAMGAEKIFRGVFCASVDKRSILECGELDRMWHVRRAYFVGCDYKPGGVKNVGDKKARHSRTLRRNGK